MLMQSRLPASPDAANQDCPIAFPLAKDLIIRNLRARGDACLATAPARRDDVSVSDLD